MLHVAFYALLVQACGCLVLVACCELCKAYTAFYVFRLACCVMLRVARCTIFTTCIVVCVKNCLATDSPAHRKNVLLECYLGRKLAENNICRYCT